MLSFTHPFYLLLFLPAVVGLAYSYRRVAGMMKNRKKVAFAIRFLLAGALIMALAGPESHRKNEGLCTIFLLDRSDSITEASRRAQVEFVDKAVKGLGPRDVAGVIAFGKDPVMETLIEKIDGIDKIQSTVTSSVSDLAAAIRLAGASFPDGKAKRIVLMSDGNETAGDALEASTVAATDGIPIDHVVLGSTGDQREVTVTNVEMPSEIRVDQAFAIKVTIDASETGIATLYLDRNGVTTQQMNVRLSEGKNTYVFNETLTEAGFHRYQVDLKSDRDHDVRNNKGMGFVAVRGRPRALIVQANTQNRELADSLKSQGIDVVLTDAGGMPSKAEDVQIYDTILFNDLNASYVNPRQQKLIQSAVRDTGVGFAMVGGEDSFLPGGWYGTPVAEVLPVDLNIRQRKTFPSTTILIICDTSGSMGMIEDGLPKVRLAAKAAEQTVKMMSSVDKVGVVASTDGIEYVAPIQTLSNKDSVIAQIQKLGVGGGGIYCLPSMQFAQKELMLDNSKVRHLILLGDGSDCDSQEGCLAVAAFMRSNKITTTCVSIGLGPHSPFLKALAAVGGGRYYLATKASQLPAIFTQDAAVMSRSAIEEGTFVPKTMMGDEVLRGIDPGSIPPLFGYCLADTRPLTRVGMRTHKDDPLLATWQYGLGSSLAFTSDAKARWAARWVEWGGFGKFWGQAIRSIARRVTSNTYEMVTNQSGGKGEVTITARDPQGNPLNTLPKEVRVALPDGSFRALVFAQTGPGEFRGNFNASEVGSYIVTVAENGVEGSKVSTSGFSVAYPPEYRSYRSNEPLLTEISSISKGEKLKDPSQSVRLALNPGFSIQELWMFFVLFAAILLPIDIAARRIALPFGEIVAKLVAWFKNRRSEATVAPAHVEKLKTAKQRSVSSTPSAAEKGYIADNEKSKQPLSKPSEGGTASTRLLDAKKKRKSGDE